MEENPKLKRKASYRFHFVAASLSAIFLAVILIMIIAKGMFGPRGSKMGDTHPSTFSSDSTSPPPVNTEQEASQNVEERAKKSESISHETMKPDHSLAQKSYYVIQVGAFHNWQNARDLTEALMNKGLDVYWIGMGGKGKRVLYRVFSGHFVGRKEAAELMKDKRILDDYPDCFIREISFSEGNP